MGVFVMLLSRDDNKLVFIKIKGRKMMFIKKIFCMVSSLFVFFNVTGLQSVTPEELKKAQLKKTSLNQTRKNMNTFESSLQKTLEKRRFAVQGSDEDQDDSWDDDTLSPKQQTMQDKLNQARAEQLQQELEVPAEEVVLDDLMLDEDDDLDWDDDESAEIQQEEEQIIFPPAPLAPFEEVEPVEIIEVSDSDDDVSTEKKDTTLPEPPLVNTVIFETNPQLKEEQLALAAAVLLEQQAQNDLEPKASVANAVTKDATEKTERKPVHHNNPTGFNPLPKRKFYETVNRTPVQRMPLNQRKNV